jgi:hypothetical protein
MDEPLSDPGRGFFNSDAFGDKILGAVEDIRHDAADSDVGMVVLELI